MDKSLQVGAQGGLSTQEQFEMNLRIAEKFYKAGCFGSDVQNAEQAFVKIQAGNEMGLAPMESMVDLYIVKGRVGLHSKGLTSAFVRKGYQIEWGDCDAEQASVTVTKNGKSYKESATMEDVKNGKAYGISPANKLKYHCLRQLINFQTPEVAGSVSNLDYDEAVEISVVEASQSPVQGQTFDELLDEIQSVESQESYNAVAAKIGAVKNTFTNEEKAAIMEVAKAKKQEIAQKIADEQEPVDKEIEAVEDPADAESEDVEETKSK